MPSRGQLIAFEGIDGSGKRTQMEMLARVFEANGIVVARVSFPQYDRFFGNMVAQFLNGDFGSLDAVDPHFSALLYAGDRLESKPEVEAALEAGKILLADRYIGSNLAHQGARVPEKDRAQFLDWLRQLEYGTYGLPKEDVVVYLRAPATAAQRLVGKKPARDYTRKRRDLQEANLAHLKTASEVYDELSRDPHWIRIECGAPQAAGRMNEAGSTRRGGRRGDAHSVHLRSPEAIHNDVLAAIEARLPNLAPTLKS